MNIRNTQRGIGHVIAVLLLVFVGAAGFAGYTVLKADQAKNTASTSASQETASSGTIQTKVDLETAGTLLDNTASQLDSDLDTSALDSDISQLL